MLVNGVDITPYMHKCVANRPYIVFRGEVNKSKVSDFTNESR